MNYDKKIIGEMLCLRQIGLRDCTEVYRNWLNDPDVNRFLETRWEVQTLDKIKDFVASIISSDHSYLFAIIKNEKHIGNIKIGPIHHIYQYADISYFIGDKNEWGKGVATETVKLISAFGFNELDLHRLQAGVFANNFGSQKVLEKNGYKKEAVFRKKSFINKGDDYIDSYMYGILRDEWR